jgi:hypothetical protein
MPNIQIHEGEKRAFTVTPLKADGTQGTPIVPPVWVLIDATTDLTVIPPILPAGILTVSVDGLVATVAWDRLATNVELTVTVNGGDAPIVQSVLIDFVPVFQVTSISIAVSKEVSI